MTTLSKKVENAKYLGVTLQSNLKWDKHINTITGKANQSLGFLRRNLKVSSTKVKDHAYKALVRPKLEYSSSVWDPHTKTQKDQIEKVQRRAARYASNRYHNTSSVTNMMQTLNWPPLEIRRTRSRLIMFYKIIQLCSSHPSTEKPSNHCRPEIPPQYPSFLQTHPNSEIYLLMVTLTILEQSPNGIFSLLLYTQRTQWMPSRH